MNQRFQNAEIKLVRKQFADDALYRAICRIGLKLEAELTGFGMCPEECFMEVKELLSDIAGAGGQMPGDSLEALWLAKYNEFCRTDRRVDSGIISKAVGIVFGFAANAVGGGSNPFYRYTLARQLIEVVAGHKFEGWDSTLYEICDVPLPDGWFDSFLHNDEPDETSDGLPLLGVLNTNRAQKYFQKAIDKGWISLEADGRMKWNQIGSRGGGIQLAYFCRRVYDPAFPYKNKAKKNAARLYSDTMEKSPGIV